MTEVLTRLLPKTLSENHMIPSSFEVIGHIAHLNLLPAHEPHKKLIG